MQIDNIEEEHDIELQDITFEDTIVNIDYAISKLRHHRFNNNNRTNQPNRNHWPETAYIYRERAVLSGQLWLHNIESFGLNKTLKIVQQFHRYYSRKDINNQIILYYNFDLQLSIVIKTEVHWINNALNFHIKTKRIFDYIQYLTPLIQVTGHSIVATIIAREATINQEILESEIVSIGEFRTFYQEKDNTNWRYYKETQEIHRGIDFQFYHNYDLFKAINYKVKRRLVLKLSHFVFLEIVIIKKNYFKDISDYYSEQNQLINTNAQVKLHSQPPHQTDRFDTVDHIITEYYPQQ